MSQGLEKYKVQSTEVQSWGEVGPGPLGGLTIHHVSFLHVPLGSSTFPTGSPWFRAHNCHLQRGVISQGVTSPQGLLIPSMNYQLPLSWDHPASQVPLLPRPLTCSHCP